MGDEFASDRLARKAKRLSCAVWILALLLCGTLVVSYAVLRSLSVTSSTFGRLSPAEQIQSASVIALAKWEKSDSTLKCVVSDILKRAPNTTFYYKVGDEFRRGNMHVTANTDYGDGQVLFFVGSPATFEFAVTFRNDRIGSMGDMPISDLRELIRRTAQ